MASTTKAAKLLRGTYDSFTLTSATKCNAGVDKAGRSIITLKNPTGSVFSLPVQAAQGEVDDWMKHLRETIDVLPRHTDALLGALAAARGRLRHIKRRCFVEAVSNAA